MLKGAVPAMERIRDCIFLHVKYYSCFAVHRCYEVMGLSTKHLQWVQVVVNQQDRRDTQTGSSL